MNALPNLRAIALLLSLSLSGGIAHGAEDVAIRRAALDSLIKEHWERTLRINPEMASSLGDKRFNDRLSDYSPAAVDANAKEATSLHRRLAAIDTSGLPAADGLNRTLLLAALREELDFTRLKKYEMPVTQMAGVHFDTPQMVPNFPFDTVKDYDDYIARLRQVPRIFSETTVQMRQGLKDGLMPPAILLPKVIVQSEAIAATATLDSPFAAPLKKFPPAFSAAEKQRLSAAIVDAIEKEVDPAYRKFAQFVRAEYAPYGRKDVGLWALPNGAERYRLQVKSATTTDLSPDQIHRMGLAEVARIEGEMLKTAKKLGFDDIAGLNASMVNNAALRPTSRKQIVDLYQHYTDQMYAKLPQLFGRLPKAKMRVEQVDPLQEKDAMFAEYWPGTPDGMRPGRVLVNTINFDQRSLIKTETTAYHEGVPGHHMQTTIAMELPNLPPFRTNGSYNAFDEGWALYAEELASEIGFYQDPYSYYGHLQAEMLRAIRLVVDTGMHEKKWSRQQVVDYFHQHSNVDEVELQSETDRYIAWPGQALGYKVGQLKFMELRTYAERQLGEKFDIRAFHDMALGSGSLPLDVLDTQVKAWVARQKGEQTLAGKP